MQAGGGLSTPSVHIRPTPEVPLLRARSDRHPLQSCPPRHVVIRRSGASFRGDHRVARDRRTGHSRAAPGDSARGKAPRLRMAAIRQVDRTGLHRHGLVKTHRMQQHKARNGVYMGNVAYPCARLWNVVQSRCWVVKNDTEYTKCGHCTYRPASFF